MPLYKTIKPDSETIIYVWKIEESYDDLIKNISLSESSKIRLGGMRSELHQRGFLSIRHLLKTGSYTDLDLYYNDNGKPHLKDKKHISITHSFNFSAIIISDHAVGIDIEKNRDKIQRISHKFIKRDINLFEDQNLVEQLTVIWGAKESLYKIYPYGGLSFREDIPIQEFHINDKETIGWIKCSNWNREYKIQFEKIEEFSLVYALDLSDNE